MKVKCFECAQLMEADDTDAVARAFVAHGQARHTWSYPEEAHPELRAQLRRGDRATHRGNGTAVRDRRCHGASGDRGPRRRLAPVLRSRRLRRQPRLGLVLLPRASRTGDAGAPGTRMAGHPGDHGCATSRWHGLRVSRVRRRPSRGMGQCFTSLRLRALPTRRSGRTRASIRNRSPLLRHRPAIPTARDRLGAARSRDRRRFGPRCVVDRGVSAQRTPGWRRGPFPRPAVHV